MNNHGNNYRDNRRNRENRGEFSGRIPKKPRGSRERSNSSDDQREEGAVPEEVDPVIEARKALEMFEEVSGEAVVHSLPISKKEKGSSRRYERNDFHKNYTNGSTDSRMIEQKRSYNNGKRNQHDDSKKEVVKQDPALEKRRAEEENAKERKKIEEEKAKRKKRKEDGEARRKKFRPTIAGLQDSNCLL
jgi:hypothetical protein